MSYAVAGCAGCSGLGFDRLVEGASASGAATVGFWVSEASVRDLGEGQASAVPEAIKTGLERQGFNSVTSAWKAGGKVWFRYGWPQGSELAAAMETPTLRRDKVKAALASASAYLSPLRRGLHSGPVVFVLAGGITVPYVASPPPASTSDAPAGDTPTSENPVVTTLPRVTKTTRELQQLLMSKGFNVGSTGADGDFGANTRRALELALGRAPAEGFVGATHATSVSMLASEWAAIMELPNRPSGSVTTPRPVPVPIPDGVALDTGGGIQLMDWLPWAIGGTALLGIGAFFLLYKPKKKVAKNRRRRRYSRRR